METQKTSHELLDLKHNCKLLSEISERHLTALETNDAIRIYTLDDGDGLILQGGFDKDPFYVLSGKVEYRRDGQNTRHSSMEKRCCPLTIPESGRLQITAVGRTTLCRVERTRIDYMIGWKELLKQLDEHVARDIRERLYELNNPLVFMRLPFENVVSAFERMERTDVKAGEDIIVQGEPGDCFYIIENGTAEIWQSGPYDDVQKKILELGKGDQFGEEALISGGTRNATVRMRTDGRLLSLAKAHFDTLIRKPMVDEVNAGVAEAMRSHGHIMIDVRYEEEWEDAHIPDSLLIPLHELRNRLATLDRNTSYLTYCQSGKRSAVAALIMKQCGFNVASLRGGMRDWTFASSSAA